MSEPMTDEALAAIRARAAAATEGPWSNTSDKRGPCLVVRTPGGSTVALLSHADGKIPPGGVCYVRGTGDETYGERASNAAFLAHARTDVPALLAEVERLRGLLALKDGWFAPLHTALAIVDAKEWAAQVADARGCNCGTVTAPHTAHCPMAVAVAIRAGKGPSPDSLPPP